MPGNRSCSWITFVEPFDLAAGLLEVVLERLAKVLGGSSFRHLRQRFDELILRAVKVLEFVNVQVA